MYKVDISNETELTQMFQISRIPIMFFISKSGEINHVGSADFNTLKYYFDGLISKK